jgi:hypothetical protein
MAHKKNVLVVFSDEIETLIRERFSVPRDVPVNWLGVEKNGKLVIEAAEFVLDKQPIKGK